MTLQCNFNYTLSLCHIFPLQLNFLHSAIRLAMHLVAFVCQLHRCPALQQQNYDIKSSTDMATATVKHMSQNQCKDIEYFLVTYVMLCSGMKY